MTITLTGEGKMGLSALFDAWALEDATDDPGELTAREQDLLELQTNLNANHTSDRKLFP